MTRLLWVLVIAIALAACASRPVDPAAQMIAERESILRPVPDYSLTARAAFKTADGGGSGRLRVIRQGQQLMLQFDAPMGQGGWRLHSDPVGAQLDTSEGRSYRAGSIDTLLREQIGWDLAAAEFQAWLLATRAIGPPAKVGIRGDGPSSIEQSGWSLTYEDYINRRPVDMPSKITARKDDFELRLLVLNWQF